MGTVQVQVQVQVQSPGVNEGVGLVVNEYCRSSFVLLFRVFFLLNIKQSSKYCILKN